MTISVNTPQIVDNYPYGRLKTKATFSIEFDVKKGFRSVFQTVNPKTGRINNPKKGTYNEIAFMVIDENGFVENNSYYLNGDIKKTNEVFIFLSKNFDIFTKEQIEFITLSLINDSKMSMRGYVMYCNSKLEDLKPLYDHIVKTLVEIVNTGENKFEGLKFDVDAIEATKEAGYNPFKITTY